MRPGWVGSMKLPIFVVNPHRGHRRGSTCQTRLIRAAQRRRAREADGDGVARASCAASPLALARRPRLLFE